MDMKELFIRAYKKGWSDGIALQAEASLKSLAQIKIDEKYYEDAIFESINKAYDEILPSGA